MPIIPHAPWRPDVATLDGSSADVYGAVPTRDGDRFLWRSFPKLAAVTSAADAAVVGARAFIMPDGTLAAFAGTAEKLLKLNSSTLDWDDVSQAATTYGAALTAPWAFERFGTNIIAVNVNDAPQVFDVGTDTEFSDLGGSPSQGSYVSVWQDQLVIGGRASGLESVQWSEINDITDWTGGNSDIQALPGYGKITGMSRGNVPMVVQETAVHRFTFTGDETVFVRDVLTEEIGCRLPGAAVFRGADGFFWSELGFVRIARDGSYDLIGTEKVDRWFRENVDINSEYGVRAVVIPDAPWVAWFCRSDLQTGDAFNTALIYDYIAKEWGRLLVDITWPFGFQAPGFTLEGLDDLSSSIDDDDALFSLDSPAYKGQGLTAGAFGELNKAGSFSGGKMRASFETKEFGLPGRRSRVGFVSPLADARYNQVVVSHMGRETRGGTFEETTTEPLDDLNGAAFVDRSARYHKLRVDLEEGSGWTMSSGVNIELKDAGRT